ncbi:MAG: copper homeostasis protein CutC [Ginsengibacter sp.]
MKFDLEVIGFSIEGCKVAAESGATRLELCDNPADGGTTPSYGFINAARKQNDIDLFVMIRPRGGDFVYTDHEIDIMKQDIEMCKRLGCDGVVLGILDAHGNVNVAQTTTLVSAAYPMSVTFHRAFDRALDPMKALKDIIECGCDRLLTSGQQKTAAEGIDLISSLLDNSGDLIIMPGSGIRSDNILSIASQLPTNEFHTSARKSRPSSQMLHPNFQEELNPITVDGEEVRKIAEVLANIKK